jgi:hypothetical protein
MSQQIQITGGAKVRNLEGVLTGTSGVVNALGINVPSGIPQLDGSGKILVSQLPNSVMEYKGTWNAATNTPTLADGTGNQGDVYLCNVAGTANFGSGPIAFFVGDQVIYSGTIWQRASGATGTVTSVAVTESGDSLNVTGSPITTSGTINIGFNGNSGQYINGAGNLTTFPSLAGYVTSVTATAPLLSSGGTTPDLSIPAASGTVDGYLDNADWTTFNNKQNAITLTTTGTSGVSTLIGSTLNIPNYSTDLSGYVPYTGATANVNLGTFDLTADVITGATGSFASSGGSNTFAINHSSGSGIALNITKGGNGEGLYINKTSGSGNAATIIGTLNATTLVKSGGTSSQFLKADGSVDASAYITLASLSAGTGITYNNTTGVITNSAPDQTVSLTQGAGISISGTYPSFTIASTITQYTDALARAALSFVAGSGAYNSTTGVITIPTNNNQITNGSNFITLTSLSAGAGISYNNTTGAISSTITQYTDALARAAISLTTTGTSGAATYNNTTGVLNIPNYAPDLSGYVTLGTAQTISGAKTFSATLTISNPSFFGLLDIKGSDITYGGQIDFYGSTIRYATIVGEQESSTNGELIFRTLKAGTITNALTLASTGAATFADNITGLKGKFNDVFIGGSPTGTYAAYADSVVGNGNLHLAATGTGNVFINSALALNAIINPIGGNVMIGTNIDAGYKLDVSGTGRFSGNLIVSKNQNAATSLQITNTTSGTSAESSLVLVSNSSASFAIGKYSTAITTYKILTASCGYLYNAVAGDISILNDYASGVIKMAAGGSSTAHFTIASTGAATFSSSVTAGNSVSITGNYPSISLNATSGTNFYIESTFTSNRLGFGVVGNAPIMALTSGGNVGIGNTGANNLLTIGANASTHYTETGIASMTLKAISNSARGLFEIHSSDGATKSVFQSVNGYGVNIGALSSSDVIINNPSGNITLKSNGNVLIGTPTDAGYKLDVNGTGRFSGALTGTSATFSTSLGLTKNSNSGTAISVTNTDAGASAIAEYTLTTNSSGFASLGKNSSTRDGAGIIDPSDTFIYSAGGGNISIFNDFSSGAIKFAAGASSTAHFTIASTGAATFSSSVTAGALSRIGDVFIAGRSGTYASYLDGVFGDNLHLGATGATGAVFINTALNRACIINPIGGNVFVNTLTGVSGGGALQVNGNVNINGVFQINGTTIGGGGGSGVTGSGTTGYVPKWSSGSSIGNSLIYDSGGAVAIGNTANGAGMAIEFASNASVPRIDLVDTSEYTGQLKTSSKIVTLQNSSNNALVLGTNGTERVRIFNDGNFGIGTGATNNGYKLQINGGASFAFGGTSVFRGSSGAGDILVANSGSTFTISGNVSVTGSVTATAGFFDTSDSRLKIVIKDYDKAKGIENVEARLYLKNSRKELGYFAQDLQEILPSAVIEGEDGFLTLSYSQVHTAKIAYLEKEVAELKELIKSLIK